MLRIARNSGVGVGLLVLTFATSALAEQPRAAEPAAPGPPAFGAKGQVVITSAFGLSVNYLNESHTSLFNYELAPSVHYFIAPELSLGLGFTIRQSPFGVVVPGATLAAQEKTLGIDAAVGYNVPLGKFASLWVRGEVGFANHSYPVIVSQFGTFRSEDNHAVWLELFAPFLIHPAPHCFIGFGPDVWGDVLDKTGSNDHKRFSAGAGSTVGGWF